MPENIAIMILGVQYYRAPFPDSSHWDEDFARIADSGMNTVQLWVLWGWVESQPGQYRWDDYDRLIELADRRGLGVVLSTKAEIQPHWIHREVPGSEMVDHMGHRVVSSNRLECHFGITPGGCTDHPGVWERMAAFLRATAERYCNAPNLRGWDAWNELRWNVHSDGYVCYCDHTLRAYRDWLSARHGGLDGLNDSWQRRYGSWDEVMPGKLPVRPFTEMMSYQHFLTVRANRHGRDRCAVIRAIDAKHPVTVHAAQPSPLELGDKGEWNRPLERGNDWHFADDLEGIGCSSFPKWARMSASEFAVRMNYIRSAAGRKTIWLSELQSAAAATENVYSGAVSPFEQQNWLWQGIAAGASAVLFWCWRDEVFGREAGGFGMAGGDGYARARLDAMKRTRAILDLHGEKIAAFRRATPCVGVWFSPQSYYLNWSQDGNAELARESLQNYCRALMRLGVPYHVVEEEHLEVLADLDVLFLPRTLVLDPIAERGIETFVQRGGVLFAESECGAWNSHGIWRAPAERWLARLTGIVERGRRQLTEKIAMAGTAAFALGQWTTPLDATAGEVLAPVRHFGARASLLSQVPVGDGKVFLCGTFLGNGSPTSAPLGLDALARRTLEAAGIKGGVRVLDPAPSSGTSIAVLEGTIGERRAWYVFTPEDQRHVTLDLDRILGKDSILIDLLTDTRYRPVAAQQGGSRVAVEACQWGIMLLVEETHQ